MCMFSSPKLKDPKLPRQPLQEQKPADFAPDDSANFTKKRGARSLRIKRSDPGLVIGGVTGGAAPASPGAQVPM